jgi:hypothetical protein
MPSRSKRPASSVSGDEIPGLLPTGVVTGLSDLAVAEGKASPAIWVERLEVYRAWPPGKGTLMRRVKLHRGLNILWAAPVSPEGTNKSRFAGHGAGKTTFCRLIRYVLGEETYGSADFREAFGQNHAVGWALAEVWVGSLRWLVGRPLSRTGGFQSFALPDQEIALQDWPAHPLKTGFKDYEGALDASVFGRMTERRIPSSLTNQRLDWPRVLQWLARDQEFHYSGLTKWRHPDSDHKGSNLSDDERSNLVRMVMGVLNPNEQKQISSHAEKARLHTAAVESRPHHDFAIAENRRALHDVLKLNGDAPEGAPPLELSYPALIARHKEELMQPVDVTELRAAHASEIARRREELGLIADRKLQLEASVDAIRDELDPLEEELPALTGQPIADPTPKRKPRRHPDPYGAEMLRHGPGADYCARSKKEAERFQCPLFKSRKPDGVVIQALATSAEKGDAMQKLRKKLKAELEPLEKELGAINEKEETLSDDLEALRTSHAETVVAITSAGSRASVELDTLYQRYTDSISRQSRNEAEITRLDQEKRAIDQKLETMKKQHNKLLEQSSVHFRALARHLLGTDHDGKEVEAWIGWKGKSISPELRANGRLDSAALRVVKYVCFDLAALMLGVSDAECHHPCFLIHDSPREADLGAEIYRELFTAVQALEAVAPKAPFQYIITTTEAPPKALQQFPWLLEPILDATVAERRILGENLG